LSSRIRSSRIRSSKPTQPSGLFRLERLSIFHSSAGSVTQRFKHLSVVVVNGTSVGIDAYDYAIKTRWEPLLLVTVFTAHSRLGMCRRVTTLLTHGLP